MKVAPIGVNRTRTVLAAPFGFAIDKGLLETTPVVKVAKPTKRERAKDRVLSDAEIRVVWRALDSVDPPLAAGLRVLLLTGQRAGQVTTMETGESGPSELAGQHGGLTGRRSVLFRDDFA